MSITFDPATAGKNLRRVRLSRNMTQAELSYDFGVSERQLRRYENNGISNMVIIAEFADYFQIPLEDILKAS